MQPVTDWVCSRIAGRRVRIPSQRDAHVRGRGRSWSRCWSWCWGWGWGCAVRSAEGYHLHHPRTRIPKRRRRAIRTGRCHHSVFGYVAIRLGDHPGCEPRCRRRLSMLIAVGPHQQICGICGSHGAAGARRVIAHCAHEHIHGIECVNAAVLQNPDVGVDCCELKVTVTALAPAAGSTMFFCVEDGLR
jgi:hypothetical protein